MFQPIKTGRLKCRIRRRASMELFEQAEATAEKLLFPKLKKFINDLPLHERLYTAWRIIIGRF